ncbi:non-ribosomal peptide synthetase [Chitinophaga qingshengii]|uniref:Amino acid adenylation domain-containing protein n=1 Tax=Chitinophaga qingshengii TaxID=1569794 RepID=A0ABR7TI28_9BACT|nr:non-ribosomal peptide synthetase [Chitinophaga qingshengii]MBC9929275.1 amino acid adenylation domain-containing protein [Chitinophaga qingshengii]
MMNKTEMLPLAASNGMPAGSGFLPDFAPVYGNIRRDTRYESERNLPVAASEAVSMLAVGIIALLYRYTGEKSIAIGVADDQAGAIIPLEITISDETSFSALHCTVVQLLERESNAAERAAAASFAPAREVLLLAEHNTGYLQAGSPRQLIFTYHIHPGGVGLSVDYAAALYRPDTIDRMTGHLLKLLEYLQYQPALLVGHADILYDGEREMINTLFNSAFDIPFDTSASLYTLFAKVAAQHPDRIAVGYEDEVVTYYELHRRATFLGSLLAEKGVRKGTVVALFLERSVNIPLSIMAVLSCGATYLPLSRQFPLLRLRQLMENSGAGHLISDEIQPALTGCSIIYIPEITGAVPGSVTNPEPVDAGSAAYIIYTSGSTGVPKGVVVTHRNVHNLVAGLERRIYSRYHDVLRIAMVAPYEFDASVQQIFGALLYGNSLYITDEPSRRDGQLLGRFYLQHKVDVSDGTPSHLRLLLAGSSPETDFKLPVQHFIIAGEVLPREVAMQIMQRFADRQVRITNLYGPTEATVDATSFDIEELLPDNMRSIPIGKPLPNLRIYIMDGHMQLLPVGVPGEICIGGHGVAIGYAGDEILTCKSFVLTAQGERLYKTGDYGRWLPDGNIEYLGRKDEQVKIRGYRIETEEVRQAMIAHPEVMAAAVRFVKEDEDAHLEAYVVPDSRQLPLLTGMLNSVADPALTTLPFVTIPGGAVLFTRNPEITLRESHALLQEKVLPLHFSGSIKCLLTLTAAYELLELAAVKGTDQVSIIAGTSRVALKANMISWGEPGKMIESEHPADPVLMRPFLKQYGFDAIDLLKADGSDAIHWLEQSHIPVKHLWITCRDFGEAAHIMVLLEEKGYHTHRDELTDGQLILFASQQITVAAFTLSVKAVVNNLKECSRGPAAVLKDIRASLQDRLPVYMIPAVIRFVQQIPLNQNGKADLRVLPALPSLDEGYANREAPASAAMQALTEIWEKVLSRKSILADDNFFTIGGDSIKAIQIAARMNKKGFRLNLKDLFNHQTIGTLAQFLESNTTGVPTVNQGTVTGNVPLLPVQRDFFEQKKTERGHYNQSVMLDVATGFSLLQVDRMLKQLLQHHDGLRLAFYEDEKQEWQQVNRSQLKVVATELVIDENEGEGEWEQQMDRLQSGLSFPAGPLVKAVLIKSGEKCRLLLIIHHLLIDGVSWRILMEDIHVIYKQINANEPISLPQKTNSYQEWANALVSYAQQPALLAERNYWEEVLNSVSTRIPFESDEGTDTIADSAVVRFQLDRETTELLLTKVHEAFNTEMNDILLAALVLSFNKVFHTTSLLLTLEGHGREAAGANLDISRTIGWFTAVYPVAIHIPAGAGVQEAVISVKETLRKVPNKGLGFGVLKHMTSNGINTSVQPQVLFNYLGQFERDEEGGYPSPSSLYVGKTQSLLHSRTHDFDFSGLSADRRMMFSLSYNRHRYSPHTMELLMDTFRTTLLEITAYCINRKHRELTPSDLTMKGLSVNEIDNLFL